MEKKNKMSKLKSKRGKPATLPEQQDEMDAVDISEQLANDGGDDVGLEQEEIDSGDSGDEEIKETRKLVMQQNRKKKKSGGFQSMGLSYHIFKGITRKGYKMPTPIQRKTIPIIMDGKDVVAMARTGSGKTAAFLIPMFEKLKVHTAKSGARAIIMAPTRELALQTLKFTKELGKFTSLRAALVLGGDKLEDQFAALHENPDIIIATPGRFLHVVMEMDMKLGSVEYIVFDEADRLFEMGFQEQLEEIIKRLPDSRQTLLFSATLPKLLVEFAKAGLHDPTLIRLDVDTKLSENLQLGFFQCRDDDKPALLLHMLQNVISSKAQTVVFAATKHHVEYLNMLLKEAGISCSYIYSALDHTARKISVAKFQKRQVMVLIVTDLAARGIDIPMLDNVINYHFPGKPKLFVHRVGRVARAGRSGTAYSLVSPDEIPFVLDLHLFLGRPMKYATASSQKGEDGVYGRVPQAMMDDEDENVRKYVANNLDLKGQLNVSERGMKQYQRSRPAPSHESVKRMKQLKLNLIAMHPLFGDFNADAEDSRAQLLDSMKSYRPNSTIFEINTSSKNTAFDIMKLKRNIHQGTIEGRQSKLKEKAEKRENEAGQKTENVAMVSAEMSSETDLQGAFKRVIAPKASQFEFEESFKKKKKYKKPVKDEEFYIPYRPKDFDSEKGLSLGHGFHQQTKNAVLDLTGDDADEMRRQQKQIRWDRKRKKFIDISGRDGASNKKKIKTESGVWIPATYQSNIYKQWVQKTKTGEIEKDADSDTERKPNQHQRGFQVMGSGTRGRKGFHQGGKAAQKKQMQDEAKTQGRKAKKYEMKPTEHIAKQRLKKESMQNFMKKREVERQKRKSSFGGKGGKSSFGGKGGKSSIGGKGGKSSFGGKSGKSSFGGKASFGSKGKQSAGKKRR